MFWSAALELKTQPPPRRSINSYGSFSRSGSFHIPQSIPEHQPVSQFTSPVPEQRRVEEYVERPDTVFARARASLQLSEDTQTALKLLLQDERERKSKSSAKNTKIAQDIYSRSKINNYSTPMKEKPERTPLLAHVHGQEEPNPQENGDEHNYWMEELERRRAGLRKSRRRTCTPISERATTSPIKVGVIMCSVPLVLGLGFVLFIMLFGGGSHASANLMNNLLDFGDGNDADAAAEHRDRIARTFARPPEDLQVEESSVMALNVSTRLRGAQKAKAE